MARRTRDNPTPMQPTGELVPIFERLEDQGFQPSILNYGKTQRVIVRKGTRAERSRRLVRTGNVSEEREAK